MWETLAYVGLILGLTISLTANVHFVVQLKKTEEKAYKDRLTGLWNRHYIEDDLPREVAKAQRSSQGLAVIMLDLDDFKLVNDALGHSSGDVCLQEVSQAIVRSLRSYDAVIRYGGDEFVVVLSPVTNGELDVVADKVRLAISGLGGMCSPITASIGAALYKTGKTAEELLEAADTAMYQAKLAGGNQVVVWDEERS